MAERPKPEDVTRRILISKFPDARTIFLAGSVIRGEGTPSSDLDLVVMFEHLEHGWRESLKRVV